MNDLIAGKKPKAFQMPKTDHFQHADGIYFNLPEEAYHADPALGSSGVRDIIVSPLKYWIKSPYNPDREDEETSATNLGDYVHDRLLHAEKKFAIKPDGMSFTTKEGKAWRDEQRGAGMTIIPYADHKAAMMIFAALDQAKVREHFRDGEPEVSFFWTEPNGFRCKIRIDYLRAHDAFELKTYANTMNKEIETAIAHTVATNRYHVSAFWYSVGLDRMRTMIRAIGNKAVIETPATRDRHYDLVHQIGQHQNAFPLWFIFMETGGVPNITVRRFVERDASGDINAYFRAAKNETDRATSTFARYMESHGPAKMWVDEAYSKAFTDEEFTAARWILEEA